jgi:hypothetical protein
MSLCSSCEYFAGAFRKGGDYVIWHPNSYCDCGDGGHLREVVLVMHRSEEYSRVDHICKANHLSDLTESSEGRIQYPEQSANKSDYEQRSLLQDLRTKDVLSSRTDWITQGIDDHGYTDGDEKFITL